MVSSGTNDPVVDDEEPTLEPSLDIPIEMQYLIEDIERGNSLGMEAIVAYARWFGGRARMLDRKLAEQEKRDGLQA